MSLADRKYGFGTLIVALIVVLIGYKVVSSLNCGTPSVKPQENTLSRELPPSEIKVETQVEIPTDKSLKVTKADGARVGTLKEFLRTKKVPWKTLWLYTPSSSVNCLAAVVPLGVAVWRYDGIVVPLNSAAFATTVVMMPREGIVNQYRELCKAAQLEAQLRQ